MNLKVTIIQSDLYWEDIDQNLEMFAQKIKAINEPTDIIVLPEMFNTGFSMESEKLAETMDGKTVTWMKAVSKKANAVVVGSLIIKSPSRSPRRGDEKVPLSGGARGGFFNRLIWAQPNGELQTYDKRHLFRMAGEHEHFSGGTERLIIEYKGWKICPLICYDLRFPVWSRNAPLNSHHSSPVYDLLIYIANWPEKRKAHWSKLLEARAIENQCYVVGVNRVGEDGNGFSYTGNSAVINYMGEKITTTQEKIASAEIANLSLEELNTWREKFPVNLDGDEFEIIPSPSK